jgi:hypothetical protein
MKMQTACRTKPGAAHSGERTLRGLARRAGDRKGGGRLFAALARAAVAMLGDSELRILAGTVAALLARRLGTLPAASVVSENGLGASGPDKIIQGEDDPWEQAVWKSVLQMREARAGGQRGPFGVSVGQILEGISQERNRRNSNRICAILRGQGLLYRRRWVCNSDGTHQRREYRFEWPPG